MKIFLPQDTVFSSNGEKSVNPVSVVEHREISDWYVDCKFTLDDIDRIKQDYILIVETKEKNEQPFRIHNIEVGQFIKCRAYHVGYDTKNYAVELSTIIGGNANACLVELKANIEPLSTPFKFSSDINLTRSFSVIDVSLYEALAQIADEYAGTLDFDGWNVYILNSIGQDRGISVEQGKNLVSATVTEDWSSVVTKIKPIGNNGILLTPEWLTADISYAKPYTKIMLFDTDSVINLGTVAQLYLDRFKVPKINYSVKSSLSQNGIAQITVNSHGELEAYTHTQLAEFSHAQLNSTSHSLYFGIGDTIVVKARQFEVTTDIISYDYNCLTKYVIGIEFGNYRPTTKNFYQELQSTIEASTTKNVQVKIDQINSTFGIAINNYNDGLLSGTYYNFNGTAFTITNSLDEVVFSADVDGNLTLVGDIRGVKDGIIRVELSEDSLKFLTETSEVTGYLKAYNSVDDKVFSISTEDGFTFGNTIRMMTYGLTDWYNTRIETKVSNNNYARIECQALDSGNPTAYLQGILIVGTQFDFGSASSGSDQTFIGNFRYVSGVETVKAVIRTNINGEIKFDSSTGNYKIFIGGTLKTITVDGLGYLKAT